MATKTTEERLRDYWYGSYENMIKTNYQPNMQNGWIYGTMCVCRALRDDAIDWTDVCADMMYEEYIEKWLNAPSVQYHIQNDKDINSLKKLLNRYLNRIAVCKVKKYNKKVNETDNTSKLSTDEHDADMDDLPELIEEEFFVDNDEFTSLFSLVENITDLGTKIKNKRLYDLVSWYINQCYDCTPMTEKKIWSYLAVKVQNPELTMNEACEIAEVTDNTIRNFQISIREDKEIKRQLHNMGWYTKSDIQNYEKGWTNSELEKRYNMPKNMGINEGYEGPRKNRKAGK